MVNRAWVLLVALACQGPTVPGDDTDTVDTDTDLAEDTTAFDTSWIEPDTDTDTDGADDTDTDTPPPETGDTDVAPTTCRFGEVLDCNNACFPLHFVGDGYCDDADDPLPADFDCSSYAADGGDCTVQGDLSDPCGFLLRVWSGSSGLDMAWELKDATGSVVAAERVGFYGGNNRFYDRVLVLPEGAYTLTGTDAFGNGWNGGYWVLVDPTSQHVVAEGRDFTNGRTKTWTFGTDCDAPTGCELDLAVQTGAKGREITWEMTTAASLIVAEAPPGVYPDGQRVERTIPIFPGAYGFRLRDAARDTWNGGWMELRYPGGRLWGARTLNTFTSVSFDFPADCAQAAAAPLLGDGQTITPTDCSDLTLEVQPDVSPRDMAFTIRRADTWTTLVTRPVGTYAAGRDESIPFTVTDGLHYVELVDDGKNGWQGGKIVLRDDASGGRPIGQLSLPDSATGGMMVTFDCPPPPVDTDETDDTDVVPAACLPGATPDCNGVCFPNQWIGDGRCDDGVLYAADFDCPTFTGDRGDCAP